MKKFLLVLILIAGFNAVSFAQDDNGDKKKKEKVLNRPEILGVSAIDAFNTKAFDLYQECQNITTAINFVQVKIKEVEDKGDGVTTEMTITNGKGENLSKEVALKQFVELLDRVTKLNATTGELMALKTPATEALSSIEISKKMKAAKAFKEAGTAEVYAVNEFKNQILLINQQISTLKSLKNN